MRKQIPLIIILFSALIVAMTIASVDYYINKQPNAEITIDFLNSEGEIKHGATGFLYGIAEDNVPNGNLLYALSPQVLATRMPNGLQHPSGDISHVEDTFFDNGGQNAIIYMQDIYPDWYYSYREDYIETMSKVLDSLIVLKHSNKFIYQPFNEMNNGVWYGDFSIKENRYKYYDAYKKAYFLIKEKTDNAPVGGPAYTDYNHDLIKEFLTYCVENECIPDVMIWHELMWYSTYGIRDTVADYRQLEKELGISDRRIIIDEYGTFKDIGTPGNLIQYIASLEATKTEGCLAFWRLPNNLNDLSASQNTPTSAWWLYHWYSQMSGDTYKVTKSKNTIPYFSAVATLNDESATIICGGAEGKARINLEGLLSTPQFKDSTSITYQIEYLDFEGLSTPSYGGKKLLSGSTHIRYGNAKIDIANTSFSRAYKISIYPSKERLQASTCERYDNSVRYEGEKFKTNGSILSYDNIRYASSGGGVMLSNGEYATCTIDVNTDGVYALEIVYTSNPMIGRIRLNPRIDIAIDNVKESVYLPNTLTDNASAEYKIYRYLNKGKHTITFTQDYGNVTIDFIDVEKVANGYGDFKKEFEGIKLNKVKGKNEYMLVVEESGYYTLTSDGKIIDVNDNEVINNIIFLKKGVNIINCTSNTSCVKAVQKISYIYSYSIELAENASYYLVENEQSPTGYYLLNAPENHKIIYSINVENSGIYALTTIYSNPETCGTHAYNVKLVERYATISVNGKEVGVYYFANTYSNFNFDEHTIYVYLEKGNNTISFNNDGSVKWNNLPTKLPNISAIQLAPISK